MLLSDAGLTEPSAFRKRRKAFFQTAIVVADFPSAGFCRQIILSFCALSLTAFTEEIYKFRRWPIASWRIKLFGVCQ
jgi:hypothetical protein